MYSAAPGTAAPTWYWVWGLGVGVWGVGCGVEGLGFELWGLGVRVEGVRVGNSVGNSDRVEGGGDLQRPNREGLGREGVRREGRAP